MEFPYLTYRIFRTRRARGNPLGPSQTFSFVLEEQSRDRVYKRDVGGAAAARYVTYYRVEKSIEDFIAETIMRKVPMHKAIMSLKKEDLQCLG